jgi:hypothetical protein
MREEKEEASDYATAVSNPRCMGAQEEHLTWRTPWSVIRGKGLDKGIEF